MNKQIGDKLDVFAKEATLADAKRVNGLRAVFGEVGFCSFDIVGQSFTIVSIQYALFSLFFPSFF